MIEDIDTLPSSANEAAHRVMQLVRASRLQTLPSMTDEEFKMHWPSVAYLYPGLHPDDALNHGSDVAASSRENHPVLERFPELRAPFYTQSGWPVSLESVAAEAWTRYLASRLIEQEMYCTSAQQASFNV
jgi:DNA (cytosine-5)-methyltransferase 1